MKRTILCIALAVSAAGQSPRTNPDITATWKTAGMWNGRFWKNLAIVSEDAQSSFVLGYAAAVEDTVIGMGVSLNADYKPIIKLLIPSKLTPGEIITALNRFYDTPENGPITIPGAMKIIAQRANGADDATIQKAIADQRAVSGR